MRLRRSSFVHIVPLDEGRHLVVHAMTDMRLPVDSQVADIIRFFDAGRTLPDCLPDLARLAPLEKSALGQLLAGLAERGVVTEQSEAEELAAFGRQLGATHGRDPAKLLENFRRQMKEGTNSYWAVGAAYAPSDLTRARTRVDVLVFGECDVQMEADFLRREARARGVDLRLAATFPDDLRFAAEKHHDAIIVGALRARHMIALGDETDYCERSPGEPYIAQVRALVEGLRAHTKAPILVDNLPEPTVQPLGLAERGMFGHRNRFRWTNLELARLAQDYPDVHIVDVAAALAGAGADHLIDDGQVSFTHFGSPGWMLQRPESERAAVHGMFPDMAPLAAQVGGDPYIREAITARAHTDALICVLGVDQKKCVIVDLDGVLWPGVLAETGAPFAWAPDISGIFSYVGLYVGIHEALLSLKRRGVLLACVSKNDEAVVRQLWSYPETYPRQRLLTLDDFVTFRINWGDKAENVASIAEELGFAPGAFVFIDDHPIQRHRVSERFPDIKVMGEDLFALRRALLTDPTLAPVRVTAESKSRTDHVRAQISRDKSRSAAQNEDDFIRSLNVVCEIKEDHTQDVFERVEELFDRTTQFNTTGRKFSTAELNQIAHAPLGRVFTMTVSDKFGRHGLVGAGVVLNHEVIALAISCRVLGLGVEHVFLKHILEHAPRDQPILTARIIETARNAPVRNLYRDNGFTLHEGVWAIGLADPQLAQAS